MDQHTNPTPAVRSGYMPKIRLAVSLLFLMNGFVTGSWAPKIPEFKNTLGIGESVLGLLILTFGVGSLVLMPIAGGFIAKLGSQKVVRVTAIILSPLLLLLTLVPNVWVAIGAMFLLGGFVGAMDVAMNANAVEVEKTMRRAIMSSCHAYWSLGGLIGSAIGGVFIAHFGVLPHAIFVTIVCFSVLAIAWPMILHDQPHPDTAKERLRLPLTPLPWLIGLVALFSMVPEGTVLDWGALYLRNELGASVALSGFGFAAFSATMAIMRFAGDHVRDRFGGVKTLRVCTLTALVGLVLAGLAPNAPLAILGFALAGIGISNMVPIAFSAAGNMPGLAPGIGLSVATFMGYSGMLFAPSLIGFIAEHTGFAVIFTCVPILFIVVLLLSHHAVHADRNGGH
ncbi:MFS family permease [Pararhizobium capsulatum DSM 1112]|uniref:MFS family permease n=1 Tax=Pararhizobium capsulatum DSM 1112 TaxID=1121113 RepID=A0ABU0BK55_9HYPH|nr:MFS transporter [Pararhizobium capsulatum]MDQ0318066.1 MFS family permease [Pararhizobium capsulatum DSM 1112]